MAKGILRSCGGSAGSCLATAVMPAFLLLLAAPPAQAQQGGQEEQPRLFAGAALAIAQPRGEFSEYVDIGGGLLGYFRVGLDDSGLLSLRVQGGFLNYGNETQRVCLSETVGCRIEVDLTTSNNIVLLGVGPELGLPLGRTRVYGHGTVGLGYFSTDSSVRGTGSVGEDPFASTRNYGDGGVAWNGGGGVEIPLGRVQGQPVLLDLGLSYQGNGRREYLTRGGIRDLPDGSLEFDVKRSQANFLLWRVGVSVGFGPGGGGR